jgi:FtsZ-binding cell division protein ZapB
MDPMGPAEARERLTRWVLEGEKLFPHLPALLTGGEATRLSELERECEKLRKETVELRRNLEDLRREHDRLKSERDEVTQAFAKLLDSVQPINQIAQKWGVRRSPFERNPGAGAPPPASPSGPAAGTAPSVPPPTPSRSS